MFHTMGYFPVPAELQWNHTIIIRAIPTLYEVVVDLEVIMCYLM